MKTCRTLDGLLKAIDKGESCRLNYHSKATTSTGWIIYHTSGTNIIVGGETYAKIEPYLRHVEFSKGSVTTCRTIAGLLKAIKKEENCRLLYVSIGRSGPMEGWIIYHASGTSSTISNETYAIIEPYLQQAD